jgi:hypothetical protein
MYPRGLYRKPSGKLGGGESAVVEFAPGKRREMPEREYRYAKIKPDFTDLRVDDAQGS